MLDFEPDLSFKDFVCIFPDFSALICTEYAKVAVNRACDGFFSFFHDRPATYCLVSLAISFTKWDGSGNIQDVFESCIDLITLIKLKSDIVGFLYSTSGLTARTLLQKCSEAKQLFSSESVQSSIESLKNTSYKSRKRLSSNEDLSQRTSENSESFEYSLTSLSQQSINGDLVSDNTLMTEENKAGIENESRVEYDYPEAHTPESNFKQFEMPTAKLMLLFKLQENQLNSTSPFSVDGEKMPAYMNDFFQYKPPDSNLCYQCQKCVIT